MKSLSLLSCLLSVTIFVNAQYIGFEEIDETKVSPWIENSPKDYFAVYHFGESEAEYEIVLFGDGGNYFAQLTVGGWGGEEEMKWVWSRKNLSDVKIEGNKFSSKNYDGEFVIYDNGLENIYGLKLFKNSNSAYEIGTKSYDYKKYFCGNYPYASYRYLKQEELNKLLKNELRIMRNEIFARYGYIFKEGGDMASYFKSKDWYMPEHINVDHFLTELETSNIQLILDAEKLK